MDSCLGLPDYRAHPAVSEAGAGLAVPVGEVGPLDLAWCKEAAEHCPLVVRQGVGREVADLAAAEEAVAADYFAKPSIGFGLAFTIAMRIPHSTPSQILTGNQFPKIGHYDERFGGNIGGPLAIPHIYNGKDRTYFFANYQHETEQTPINTFSTVPTLQERQGIFCGTHFVPAFFQSWHTIPFDESGLPASSCQRNFSGLNGVHSGAERALHGSGMPRYSKLFAASHHSLEHGFR